MRDLEAGSFVVRMWRSLFAPGMEHCRYSKHWDGRHSLEGTVLIWREGEARQIEYKVDADPEFRARKVEISLDKEDADFYSIEIAEDNKWTITHDYGDDIVEIPWTDAATDIDLGFTPATYLLPIRRLSLKVGESHTLAAVGLSFPEHSLRQLTQRFTRLASDRYRYETAETDTEFSVDDRGIVVDFVGRWELVK